MCRTSRTPASRFRNCIIQFWHSSTGCGCLHAFSVHYLDGFPINVPLLLQRTEAFPLDAARFQFFEHASSNSRTGGIEHPTPTAEMGEGEGCLGLLNGCFFLRSSHIHISEQHFSFRHSPIACAFPDDFREYHALLNACRWRLSHLSSFVLPVRRDACSCSACPARALRSELQDGDLGPAPVVDLLGQLEVRMEEQVAAYLERMHEVCRERVGCGVMLGWFCC